MNPQARYIQIGRLLESMPPELLRSGEYPPAVVQWLARAFALVSDDDEEKDAFRASMDRAVLGASDIMKPERVKAIRKITAILYRSLAVAELAAPASVQGAFIQAGNQFDAIAAFAKIAGTAKTDFLIVDPYMDEKALTEFALTVPEYVSVRLLADEQSAKANLRSAVGRWVVQYGAKRPLALRFAPAKTLHDRLLMVDNNEIWIVTQSLNAIASRSPASIVRVEGEPAVDKVAAYDDIWNKARAP